MAKIDIAGVWALADAAIKKDPSEARRIILEAGELDCKSEHFIPIQQILVRSFYKDEDLRGGVHDNQGLSSLLEQNCRVILVSDSSGQFQEQTSPGGSVSDSLGNSNAVLQARVREAQFDQLSALRRAGAIQGSMFIHLTKDLEARPVTWIGPPEEHVADPGPVTSYGIDRKIQLKLAEVRTDLDSFSNAEAYALMTSGYRMTEHALVTENCLPSLKPAGARQQWEFLAAEDALTRTDVDASERMLALLQVSNELAWKVWKQLPSLQKLRGGLIVSAVIGGGYALWKKRMIELPSLGVVALIAIVLGAAKWILAELDKRRQYHKRLGEMGLGFLIAIVGWIAAGLHLLIFDRLFLDHGKWEPATKQATSGIATSGPHVPVADSPPPSASGVPSIPSMPEAGGEQPQHIVH